MKGRRRFKAFSDALQEFGIGAAWFDGDERFVHSNDALDAVQSWNDGGRFQAALSPGSAVYWETSIEPFLSQSEQVKDVAISLETSKGPKHFLAFAHRAPDGIGIVFVPYEERYRFERQMRDALRDAGHREAEWQRIEEMGSMHQTFIKSVAHELATPMTPILLELSILERMAGDGHDLALAKAVQRIKKNVAKLQHFQDSIVEAARLQDASAVVEPTSCDLATLVRSAIQSWQVDHPDVVVHLETGPTQAHADEAAVRNCLRHILDNAARFSPAGSPIQVSVSSSEGAQVRVVDRGRGIEAKTLRRLGRPFTKGHSENEFTQLGAGLGLFIVRGLMELQGGSLRLQSKGPGEGTTAILRLPLTAPAPKVEAQPRR